MIRQWPVLKWRVALFRPAPPPAEIKKTKLFQFLNKVGARALRIQLGRVLERAESSPDKFAYKEKIVKRFVGQQEFELVVPPPLEMKEAAN